MSDIYSARAIQAQVRSVDQAGPGTLRPDASRARYDQVRAEAIAKARAEAAARARAEAAARAAAARRAAQLAAQQQAQSQPSTPPAVGVYSYAALEQLWMSAGGPSWAASAAASVAECESGGRVDAYNPSGASGLWQILGQVVGGYILDPMVNAENAVSKFEASGDTWAQWTCKP